MRKKRRKKFEITECNQQGKEKRKKEQKNHFKNFAFLKSKARKNHKRTKDFNIRINEYFSTNKLAIKRKWKFLNLVEASAKAT